MDKGILFGIGGIIVGFIFNGLLKERWKSILAKENEKLKNEFSKELTALQSNLTSQREKDSFKFSKFHEKKFEVYEELYSLLNKYFVDLTVFCNPANYTKDVNKFEQNRDVYFKELMESQKNLLVYFDNKKIYLNKNIVKNISNFIDLSNQSYVSYNLIQFFEEVKNSPFTELYHMAYSSYEEIKIKLIPIKMEIEKILKDELSYYETT